MKSPKIECPECDRLNEDGDEGYTDHWSYSRDTHYTKGTGVWSFVCECGCEFDAIPEWDGESVFYEREVRVSGESEEGEDE